MWNIFNWRVLVDNIPSFVKTGTGVEATVRFFLNNLRGCNVGITDGRDL
jgi:hypothetical protein